MTQKLKLRDHSPAYTKSVDIFDLPKHLHEHLRKFGIENEDFCYDYRDGDYYLKLNFTELADVTLSDEALEAYLQEDDEYDTTGELFEEFEDLFTDGGQQFGQAALHLAMRHIVKNVPSEVVAENKLAINIWH